MQCYGVMPERGRKDQVEDSIKQACSCWCSLAIVDKPHEIILLSSRCFSVLIADAIFNSLCFVLFRFRFFFIFIEPAVLRPTVLRYAYAPAASRNKLTTVYVLFFFLFLVGDAAFSHYCVPLLYRFLFIRRIRRTFSFRFIFVFPVTTGWILTSDFM